MWVLDVLSLNELIGYTVTRECGKMFYYVPLAILTLSEEQILSYKCI